MLYQGTVRFTFTRQEMEVSMLSRQHHVDPGMSGEVKSDVGNSLPVLIVLLSNTPPPVLLILSHLHTPSFLSPPLSRFSLPITLSARYP